MCHEDEDGAEWKRKVAKEGRKGEKIEKEERVESGWMEESGFSRGQC